MASPDSQMMLPSAVTQDIELDLTGLSIHDEAGTSGSHDLQALQCDPTAAQHAPGCEDGLPPIPLTFWEFRNQRLCFTHANFENIPSDDFGPWIRDLHEELQTALPQELVKRAQLEFYACLKCTTDVEHALFDLFQAWGQEYFYLGKGKQFVRRVGGRVQAVWWCIELRGKHFVNGGTTPEQKRARLLDLIHCFNRSQDQLMRLTEGIRQPGVFASKIESISA